MREPKRRGKSDRVIVSQPPGNHRRQIVRRFGKSKSLGAAQPAIKFQAGGKILAAENARLGGGHVRQLTRDPQCVTELYAFLLREVFFYDKVFGNVPVF